MKFSIILVSVATICLQSHPSFSIAPIATKSVAYSEDEWVANVQCAFHYESECDLSIHVNGRRIDLSTHRTNEDVYLSCLDEFPAIDLFVRNLTFDDVREVTCLRDSTEDFVSFWLDAPPVIETEGVFEEGEKVSLTCNAPSGSSLYWLLPGLSSDHSDALITHTPGFPNASSSLTFTVKNTDYFANYRCCVGQQDGQPPLSTCTNYTLVTSQRFNSVTSQEDYRGIEYQLTTKVQSNPLLDSSTVTWKKCINYAECVQLPFELYSVVDEPSSYSLTTQLLILATAVAPYDTFLFSVHTFDGESLVNANFMINNGSHYPILNKLPNNVTYNEIEDTYTCVIKVLVSAEPSPTITWTKRVSKQDSTGSEDLTSDGIFTINTTQVSPTEWETSLTIEPYNQTLDSTIFTVWAENVYGENSIDVDATLGPALLTVERYLNDSAVFSFRCIFEDFPPPPTVQINVIAPYDTFYNITESIFNPENLLNELIVDVTVDPQNTYFIFSCTAFNAFDPRSLENDYEYTYFI